MFPIVKMGERTSKKCLQPKGSRRCFPNNVFLWFWDPAGLVWHGKRPKAGNGKNGNRNGTRPQAGRGQKWQKNGPKMDFWGVFHYFSIFGPFFAIFAPVQLGAVFHSDFHFFSISGFWPFSMPYQPGRIPTLIPHLSGMFRSSTSLAIPHRRSFATIPRVSLVLLEHMNRNVFVVTRIAVWNCPRLGTFKTDSWLPTGRSGGFFWRFAGRWHRTTRIHIRIAAESHDTMPLSSSSLHRDEECLKHQSFQAFWCLLPLRILTTLWTHHSEKHRSENTVCHSLIQRTGITHFLTTYELVCPFLWAFRRLRWICDNLRFSANICVLVPPSRSVTVGPSP